MANRKQPSEEESYSFTVCVVPSTQLNNNITIVKFQETMVRILVQLLILQHHKFSTIFTSLCATATVILVFGQFASFCFNIAVITAHSSMDAGATLVIS
jgi:hypothetical protein